MTLLLTTSRSSQGAARLLSLARCQSTLMVHSNSLNTPSKMTSLRPRFQSSLMMEDDTLDFTMTRDDDKKPIFVAATKQHVGKTSASLALMSGLQKRFDHVGKFTNCKQTTKMISRLTLSSLSQDS